MIAAAYHYKRRAVLGRGRPSAWQPRGAIMYGKWQTIASAPTLDEARAAMRKDFVGLYDRAIFHRGRRLAEGAS